MPGDTGGSDRRTGRLPGWVAHFDPTPFGTVVVGVLSVALIGMAVLDPVGTAAWLLLVLGAGTLLGVTGYALVALAVGE